MIEFAFLFGSVRDERAQELADFFDALPRLCRGALADCDVGIGSSADVCGCVVRFRGPVPETLSARLAFWVRRLGGSVTFPPDDAKPEQPATAGASPLRSCGTVIRAVTPGLLGSVACSLLVRLPGVAPELEPGRLSLLVETAAPENVGLRFERQRQALFIPCPRSPPLGDDVVVRLRLPGGEEQQAEGVVTALRAAGEDGPGTPAGFLLGLVTPTKQVMDALEAHAGPAAAATDRRRAPRYPVRSRARVARGVWPGARPA